MVSEVITTEGCDIVEITPDVLKEWLAAGDTVLIDVREPFEHAGERIQGAKNVPLSSFDPASVRREHGDKRVVFHCRTGKRSAEAATKFGVDAAQTFHLAGGIESWKQSGESTERSAGAPKIDVMRQVQITAGSLVLLGVLLGVFVSPWFLILSGFVGGGLTFAGLSGWCGMAKLLARMPWNARVSC
ncbi:MAG: rhodanese-like domain-containing protein [Phycisphaerales bacterium]|nr:rhodanese-like domain-containing protein [Phycisphaerales bacterium]